MPVDETYGKTFITGELNVKFSNLLKPDTKFGDGDHNITVVVSDALKAELDRSVKQFKAKKANGIKDADGETTLRCKSTLEISKGNTKFPCIGPDAAPTDDVPFGGDTVKLKLTPRLVTKYNTVTFYLQGVQIVNKVPRKPRSNEFTAINMDALPF